MLEKLSHTVTTGSEAIRKMKNCRLVQQLGPRRTADVGLSTWQIATLRIARRARLVGPGRILLQHQTQLTEGFSIACHITVILRGERLIRALTLRQRIEIRRQ